MNKIRELLADNIRADVEGDDDELRQSLKANGWVAELPALADEAGVVLVGNRRLRLAKELGITPIIRTVTFGSGDAADAERVRLAIVSNVGGKPMTKQDRQRIAEHLYGARQWTMERIAEALSVTHKTISKDLSGFVPEVQTSRPKGGRPKASKYSPDFEQRLASAVLDKGKSRVEAAVEAGVSNTVVRRVVAREVGRREVEPVVTRDDFPPSMQKKLDAMEQRIKRELAGQFDHAVQQGIDEHLALILPDFNKRKVQYETVMNRHKGIFRYKDYRLLLACLHPDGRATISDETLTRLRQFVEEHEVVLCREREPVAPLVLPATVEEWRKMKQRSTKSRRSKRAGNVVKR